MSTNQSYTIIPDYDDEVSLYDDDSSSLYDEDTTDKTKLINNIQDRNINRQKTIIFNSKTITINTRIIKIIIGTSNNIRERVKYESTVSQPPSNIHEIASQTGYERPLTFKDRLIILKNIIIHR